MRDIPIFGAEHDCPHPTGSDPTFQESSLFVWHDLKAGVGGFWRLGQEAVAGMLNSCFGMFTDDGLRFRSNVTGAPMVAGDRGATHMAWGDLLRVDLDRLAIRAKFPDCEASLKFEDFYPRYDYFTLMNRPGRNGGALGHHFEVGGRMTGRVRIGDRELEIDALGYRDRSWGPRTWNQLRGTRWWPCVFGPDLCAHVVGSVHETGMHGCYGYVFRNGEALAMTGVDITATLDYDAIGPRSGHARFTLENGEVGELHHERSDGILLHVRGYSAIESIGTARWGDRVGMSNFEVSTNPAGGSKPPVLVLNASSTDGLSHRNQRT